MKNIIKSILEAEDTVLFAYLFGSYARNEQREESDVDIAVYLKNTSLESRLEIHHALEY